MKVDFLQWHKWLTFWYIYAITFGSAHFWKKCQIGLANISNDSTQGFKNGTFDSGKCPIMWKLYLAYLVNFAEEAGLVEFAGDLSGQKIKMGFVFWVQKLSLWEIHQNLKWAPLQSHRLVSNLTIALIFIVCIGLYRFWKCINASLWPQRTKRMEVSSFTT